MLAANTSLLEPAPPGPRRYTLTHNDITGKLRLCIGPDYNWKQISGFYTRLLRDEVCAEWVRVGSSSYALHVYCHVSGEERWLAPPLLRNYIFRREMPLVLDSLVYADRQLLAARPELAAAEVYVHFQSSVRELDTVEYWGVLGDRVSWPKGPTSILMRTIYAVVGWPSDLAALAQPADLSVDLPDELNDLQAAIAQAQAAQRRREQARLAGPGQAMLSSQEEAEAEQLPAWQGRELDGGALLAATVAADASMLSDASARRGPSQAAEPGPGRAEEAQGQAELAATVAVAVLDAGSASVAQRETESAVLAAAVGPRGLAREGVAGLGQRGQAERGVNGWHGASASGSGSSSDGDGDAPSSLPYRAAASGNGNGSRVSSSNGTSAGNGNGSGSGRSNGTAAASKASTLNGSAAASNGKPHASAPGPTPSPHRSELRSAPAPGPGVAAADCSGGDLCSGQPGCACGGPGVGLAVRGAQPAVLQAPAPAALLVPQQQQQQQPHPQQQLQRSVVCCAGPEPTTPPPRPRRAGAVLAGAVGAGGGGGSGSDMRGAYVDRGPLDLTAPRAAPAAARSPAVPPGPKPPC